MAKDVNGAPIPDSPRGIPLLGDGDGAKLFPTGMNLVENQSPSGITGTGMVCLSPAPIPADPPCQASVRRPVVEAHLKAQVM
jgi:hypothetical protein